MSLQDVMAHIRMVENVIDRLAANLAFAFALAGTERQMPVLERASQGTPWKADVESVWRHGLDAAWHHVLDGSPLEVRWVEACQNRMPSYLDMPPDDASGISLEIVNSICDLLSAIKEGDKHWSYRISSRNISVIEGLLDVSHERPDDHSDQTHPLIEAEEQRQREDLAELQQFPNRSGIEAVRRRSVGKSLYGTLWFKKS